MRTLDQIRDFIAYECGYPSIDGCSSWQNLLNEVQGDTDLIDHYVGCVAFMYAEEVLKEAADKAEMELWTLDIDKNSILSIIDRLN